MSSKAENRLMVDQGEEEEQCLHVSIIHLLGSDGNVLKLDCDDNYTSM